VADAKTRAVWFAGDARQCLRKVLIDQPGRLGGWHDEDLAILADGGPAVLDHATSWRAE
jgi:hypothetical protein